MILRILASVAAVIILALIRRARRGRREVWVIKPYASPLPARRRTATAERTTIVTREEAAYWAFAESQFSSEYGETT